MRDLNESNLNLEESFVQESGNRSEEKRIKLEKLIALNSSLIDLLKDACEFNIDLEYIANIHSALSVISEKQLESLKLASELLSRNVV